MNSKLDKKQLYTIIFESDTPAGKAFDVTLLWTIVASIALVIVETVHGLPPFWKTMCKVMEYLFTFAFTLEYATRIYCAPKRFKYITSFYGIIDLLSTLPLYIGWIIGPARYLMMLRTFRLMRVFRVLKLFSFLEEGDLLMKSIRMSARKIFVFFLFVVVLTIVLGSMMYMVEGNLPNSEFEDIPTSIYWAIVTMTTVGYGDIAPVTTAGRFLSAIVMLMGYTIMAVPTGIVSAQFIQDNQARKKKEQPKCTECGGPLPKGANFCPHCGNEVEKAHL